MWYFEESGMDFASNKWIKGLYISSKLQSDYAMFGNTRQCLLCGGSACKPVWSTLKRVVWYFEDGGFLICKAIYYKVILIGRSLAYILKCSIADQYKIVLYTRFASQPGIY